MIAELLLFGLVVFVAYTFRKGYLQLKEVDKQIAKMEAIEEAKQLIDNKIKEIRESK